MGIPNLQLGVFPSIPHGYDSLSPFPVSHLRRVFPKGQDQQLRIIPQGCFRFMFVPSSTAAQVHLPNLNGSIQGGGISNGQPGEKLCRLLLLLVTLYRFPRRQCLTKGPNSFCPALGGAFPELAPKRPSGRVWARYKGLSKLRKAVPTSYSVPSHKCSFSCLVLTLNAKTTR